MLEERRACVSLAALLYFMLVILHNQESASGQSIEEIVKHGVSLWKNYCSSKEVNQTFVIDINRCMLKSVNLNDKLMSNCLKKYLPAKDNQQSIQRLQQAQCFNPKDANGSRKLNEVSVLAAV